MNNKPIRRIAFAALLITITGFLLLLTSFVVYGNEVLSPYRAGNYQEETMTFNKDDLKNIDLSLVSKNVTIKEGADDTGTLKYGYFKDDQLVSELNGGTLKMSEQQKWRFFFIDFSAIMDFLTQANTKSLDVELTLPKGITLNDINLSMASGNFLMNNITADTIRLNLMSGNSNLSHITASSIDMDVASGDQTLDTIKTKQLVYNIMSGNIKQNNIVADTISYSSASGNMTGNTLSFKTLTIDSMSGNIDLFGIEGTEKDYAINTDMISGNLFIDNQKYGGFSQNITTPSATRSIGISSASGNASLSFSGTAL